ncbi:hypothetical protein C0995_013058 [Termitomyces sp. Mi166|nr:hypothetical protein C0995_013058 [Termitomyces sp. Mi166\
MSRHRHIRNINIQDELDDDALSDGGEEEITDEQHAQLLHGLEEVRQVIGDEYVSGFSDNELKDVLWECFFDIEKTIQWALEEQNRRQIARERKEPDMSKDLPPVPQEPGEGHSNAEYYYPEQYNNQGSAPPRGPLILLHQTPAQALEMETPRGVRPALSTITECTERSETTPRLPPGRKLAPHRSPRPLSTFTTSSYGQVIGETDHTYASYSGDPNSIPVSPSLSALNELSLFEPAASIAASDSASVRPFKAQHREPILPDKVVSETAGHVSQLNQESAPPTPPPKQSKLSRLASSRASSISTRSESSRSSGTTLTGSVKTFPALRPSPQSLRPPSSQAASDPPSLRAASTAPGANEEYFNPRTTQTSSMTSLVRRAINTAMELEALDNAAIPNIASNAPNQLPVALASSASAGAKSLAQRQPRLSAVSSTPSPAQVEPPRIYKEVDTFRTQSKLALLAQKSSANRAVKLPKPVTEYLTPAANGPTATTAITTSIQTLRSLTDPTRSRVMPALDVVPFGASPSVPPPVKGSKLAAKIRKAHEKQNTAPQKEEDPITLVSPIFHSESTVLVRASPSAFGSLLVDDTVTENKLEHYSSRHQDKDDFELTTSPPPVAGCSEKRKNKSRRNRHEGTVPDFSTPLGFKFDGPSPDDIVMNARPAKEREKALKKASGTASASSSRPSSAISTPTKKKIGPSGKKSGLSTPARGIDPRQLDLSALNLSKDDDGDARPEEPPSMSFAKEKLLEEAKRAIEAEGENGKKGVSLVVVGHVDAGKSTLMGRLLYELGRLEEKTRIANERGSAKVGKSSFSWAWGLDGTTEERERGITMDIALQSLATPHRQVTILDAPGHKDFIPNMISGASQADCALLVVDAAHGEFEAGFERGGQTREHLLLVRSLGVAQVIVAVNKLDQASDSKGSEPNEVDWNKDRYGEICSLLRPFLVQSGFHPSKTKFVPVGAMEGVNLVTRDVGAAAALNTWYSGPTLVDLLGVSQLCANHLDGLTLMIAQDALEPPSRDIMAPLRIPISNVFKSHGSDAAVAGRLCSGVIQVGERLRILPGDETAVVKTIEVDDRNVSWAAAGTNVTLYLTSVDPVNLHIGSVLCSTADLVPLATSFSARIIVFDIQVPITAGTSVCYNGYGKNAADFSAKIELFHHSRDVPATVTKLTCTLDRASGKVLKTNPRVLTKSTSAEVKIGLRTTTLSGPATARPIPLETFATNKDMGRILIRRGGETIGAGIVLAIDV